MVLYQHASRKIGRIEKRRTAFQDACKGGRVLQFCSPNSARDVRNANLNRAYQERSRNGRAASAQLPHYY